MQSALYRGKEVGGDVQSELPIEFTNAGRARYVDLREIVANDVQSRKDNPFSTQHGPNLGTKPTIALGEFASLCSCPHGQVAATLARRGDSSQRIVDRFSIYKDDTFVTVRNLWNELLRERVSCAVIGQCLEDDIGIRLPQGYDEYRSAAHPVEGL